jgi:hypothetical protein
MTVGTPGKRIACPNAEFLMRQRSAVIEAVAYGLADGVERTATGVRRRPNGTAAGVG